MNKGYNILDNNFIKGGKIMWSPILEFIKLTEDGFYYDFSNSGDDEQEGKKEIECKEE